MKQVKQKAKAPILYPLPVTTEFVDRCQLQAHPFTKHLKIGHFILVEMTEKGFLLPKHPRQYDNEKSSAMAFHLYCKQKEISPLAVVELLSKITGAEIPSQEKQEPATENADGVLKVVK